MLYNNLSSRTLVRDLMSLSVKPREILTSVRDESSTCCKRNIYLKNSQKKDPVKFTESFNFYELSKFWTSHPNH